MTNTDLNAKLAEKLLGWFPPGHEKTAEEERQYARDIHEVGVSFQQRTDRWLCGNMLLTVEPDVSGEGGLPDLSGSWEGCGLVLEAMWKRGWCPSLFRNSQGPPTAQFHRLLAFRTATLLLFIEGEHSPPAGGAAIARPTTHWRNSRSGSIPAPLLARLCTRPRDYHGVPRGRTYAQDEARHPP